MREYFWKLSGADYIVINQCETLIQKRFFNVGLLVFLNGIVCFFSGLYAFSCFSNIILSILISLFFTWMVSNIYVVLLTTLTKNLLPHKKEKIALLISTSIRVVFLVFIGIIISKPLEVAFLSFFEDTFVHSNFASNLKHYNNWLITIIIVALYVLPAALKYYLVENNIYYIKKARYDKYIILEHYEEFKANYKRLMYEKTGKIIEFKERFKDAPFNTKPITDNKTYKSEEDFINLIYKIEN